MDKQRAIKIAALFLIIMGLVSAGRYFGLEDSLSPSALRDRIEMSGPWAPVFFLLTYVVATVAFLPGSPLSILGGAIFGPWAGLLYVVAGATIGAGLAFFLSRWLGRGFVRSLVSERFKKLERYDARLEERGMRTMLFLRLIPLFPFNGLNFALGLTRVKARHYLLGTFLGIIPGAFAFVYFGDAALGADWKDLVVASLLIAVLFAVGPIYKKFKNH